MICTVVSCRKAATPGTRDHLWQLVPIFRTHLPLGKWSRGCTSDHYACLQACFPIHSCHTQSAVRKRDWTFPLVLEPHIGFLCTSSDPSTRDRSTQMALQTPIAAPCTRASSGTRDHLLPLLVSPQMFRSHTRYVSCTRDLECCSALCFRIHHPCMWCASCTSCVPPRRATGELRLLCVYNLRSACSRSPRGCPDTCPFHKCGSLLTRSKRNDPECNARTTCGPQHNVRRDKMRTQTH